MKNRIFLLATALLCALAICFSAVPALSVFAEDDIVTDTETETEAADELTNLALNAYVWQNDVNCINDGERFALEYLVDGSALTSWHGDYVNTDGTSAQNPTQLTIDLGFACEISSITVYAYDGDVYATAAFPEGVPVLPQAFTVEVFSVETFTWVEVGRYTLGTWDIGTPDPDELTYDDFDPILASEVRMTILQNGGYWDPNYFRSGVTVVGDIEVMGTVVGEVPDAPTVTTPAQTDAETEAETVAETVADTVAESEIEADSETVEVIVDETVGETGVEETVADTTAPTATDDGCASVVGFGAVAVLTAAAAAVVLKKKD